MTPSAVIDTHATVWYLNADPLDTLTRLEEALRSQDAVLRVADLTMAVALAVSRVVRDEVPDMPDRIIAGTALHFGVPVISRDSKIKTSMLDIIW